MNKSFIKMNNLSLDYFHYMSRKSLKKTIVKSVFNFLGAKEETFILRRALDGIDATFQTGDRIALIGKNGSGKSTLLRVLSGIYQPTAGFIEVQGNISSLLDISVGLNTDATGYENIILMGILQGKTKNQMKSKFKEIEDFTELKDYLKIPVRTYSTGMRLRLAFGIATCMESDILIIDEVIGVGDQSFMEKAQTRLKDLVHKSQILILTSHSTQILQHFCNKSMILDEGKCTFFGDLQKGIEIYEGKACIQTSRKN
jgi:ABC-type polysaccharide/polyol phosphate transport system ATPase subunit